MLGCRLPALYASGLYQRSWETFGLRDLAAVVRGVGLGSLLVLAVASLLYRFEGFQRGVFVLDPILLTLAIMITRGSFRAMGLVASTRSKRNRRVLVYGAGAFGRLLVREMRANQHWHMNPVGFLDDDPAKAHRWIAGVPVRGAHRRSRARAAALRGGRSGAEQPGHQRQRRGAHPRGLRASRSAPVRRFCDMEIHVRRVAVRRPWGPCASDSTAAPSRRRPPACGATSRRSCRRCGALGAPLELVALGGVAGRRARRRRRTSPSRAIRPPISAGRSWACRSPPGAPASICCTRPPTPRRSASARRSW